MIDKRQAAALKARLEKAAMELGPHERLWFEVHSLRQRRRGFRWKAAICRPQEVRDVFFEADGAGAVFSLDYPSQLAEWLETLGVRPVQPVPNDWHDMVFFGCDVELTD